MSPGCATECVRAFPGQATTVEGDPTRLHTLLSCLVDYAGHRLICQAIIPGILNGGGSTLLFGALDAEDPGTVGPHTSDYGEHALFAQLVDNLAVRFVPLIGPLLGGTH